MLVVIVGLFFLIYVTSVDLKQTTMLSIKNEKWNISGVKVISEGFTNSKESAFNRDSYDLQWNITWRMYGVNSSSLLNEVQISDSLKKAADLSKTNTEIFMKDLPLKLPQQLIIYNIIRCYLIIHLIHSFFVRISKIFKECKLYLDECGLTLVIPTEIILLIDSLYEVTAQDLCGTRYKHV